MRGGEVGDQGVAACRLHSARALRPLKALLGHLPASKSVSVRRTSVLALRGTYISSSVGGHERWGEEALRNAS